MIVNDVINYEKRGKTRASEARLAFFSGAIGIGFASHWLKSGANFTNQSQSVVMQRKRILKINFSIQLIEITLIKATQCQ